MAKVFIIDPLEHGNGGVYDHRIVARLPLDEALNKHPRDFGVVYKEWGFWPFISLDADGDDIIYRWNNDENMWIMKEEHKMKPTDKPKPSKNEFRINKTTTTSVYMTREQICDLLTKAMDFPKGSELDFTIGQNGRGPHAEPIVIGAKLIHREEG